MPASIASGDIVVIWHRAAGAGTVTPPSSFTVLADNIANDASDDIVELIYRVATGAEPATVTFGQGSVKFASTAWRISGGSTSDPILLGIGPTVGTSTTPSGGTAGASSFGVDALWFALASWSGEQATPPTYPGAYTLGRITANSSAAGAVATNCQAAGACQNLNSTAGTGTWQYEISVAPTGWTTWDLGLNPSTGASTAAAANDPMLRTLMGVGMTHQWTPKAELPGSTWVYR
jgi:hypothetical protein